MSLNGAIFGSKNALLTWFLLLIQQKRLVSLLAYEFRKFELSLALSLIDPDRDLTSMNRNPTTRQLAAALSSHELNAFLSPHDLNRLELYARNMVRFDM